MRLTKLGVCVLTVLMTGGEESNAAVTAGSFGHYRPVPGYHERVSRSEYVALRDGVRIAVRVSRPSMNGAPVQLRFPVIWQHALTVTESSPSSRKPDAGYKDVPALTDYGYVVVQVARRGNGQSFGSRRGYNDRTEADDAYELTEWLAEQPWSNGRVGIYGCSNTGDAAMQPLTTRPPHLQAVFAGCFSWSKFDAFHRGGIYAQWGTGPQRTVAEDTAIEPVDGDANKTLLGEAAVEHQLSTNLYELWKSMPYRDSWSPLLDSRFWYEGSISSFADRVREARVPVYIQGGWHDELRDQGLIALVNLPGSRILIGPWKHCENPGFELLQEIHRFFDTYLKDIDTGLRTEPRIHYYTPQVAAAAGLWHVAADWPLPGVHAERLFIHGSATLAPNAPADSVRGDFVVHVNVACPDKGMGPFAQPCHVDGEGLSFAGEPLPRDVEMTGSPILRLRISSQRPDASVFAYLEDLAPGGVVTPITEGRLRASLRDTQAAPWRLPGTPWHRSWAEDTKLLHSEESATLTVELMPTSYVVAAGHRIQLTVTGADYRERNRDADADGNRVTVLSAPGDESYVDLPILSPSRPTR